MADTDKGKAEPFVYASQESLPYVYECSAGDEAVSQPRWRPVSEKLSQKATSIAPEPKTSLTAWLLCICVMFVNSACSWMWMTAPSAPMATSAWMHIGLTRLNWLSNISAICNSTFSIVAGWAYGRFGLKACIAFSATTNCIGCWLRCAAILVHPDYRYVVVTAGQVIASMGGPFIYNIGTTFVAVWFAPRDRAMGNTLVTLCLGFLLGPLVTPLLVPTAEHTPRALLVIAAFATATAIPIFFFPSKPKVAPSATALGSRMSIWEGVKALAKNKYFWSIAIMASFNAGMAFTYSVVLIEAIAPYGYTEWEGGICVGVLTVSGFLGGLMTGYWAGRTSQHLMIIKMFTPLMIVTYFMSAFMVIRGSYPVIVAAAVLLGFFAYALMPLHFEYACEICYPVPESVTSNMIWTLVTVFMLLFTVITDALRAGPSADPPENMKLSMIVASVLVTVGSLPCIWLKGDLKRLAMDYANDSANGTP